MNNDCLVLINKFSGVLASLYDTKKKKEELLEQIDYFKNLLDEEKEIKQFFRDHFMTREQKKEVIAQFGKFLDEYFVNTLCILVDKALIFYLELFLSTLKSCVQKQLNIQNVYVYSSFPIIEKQKTKIEKLWQERLSEKICEFHYAIDKSLRLGIKVQVNTYIEEFSLNSNLLNVKIKLNSIII